MKKVVLLLIPLFLMIFFMSCDSTKDKNMDMSIEKFMAYDIPYSCKMAYVCWKTRGKTDEKSACEKYSELCKDQVKLIDAGITESLIKNIVKKYKENNVSLYK